MKTLAVTFALAGFLAFGLRATAQDAIFIAPDPDEIVVYEEQPESVEERPVGFQGIVSQIFRAFQPWQLINPLAPEAYGSGEQNVSKDEDWAAPYYDSSGLVVFGVEW